MLLRTALDYKTEKMYISFMIDKELSLCKTLEKDFATEIISGCQFAIRGADCLLFCFVCVLNEHMIFLYKDLRATAARSV